MVTTPDEAHIVQSQAERTESIRHFKYGGCGFVPYQVIGYRVTPAEISRRLLRESHSISQILNRMENKGLVRWVKDLERKNLVRLILLKVVSSDLTKYISVMCPIFANAERVLGVDKLRKSYYCSRI